MLSSQRNSAPKCDWGETNEAYRKIDKIDKFSSISRDSLQNFHKTGARHSSLDDAVSQAVHHLQELSRPDINQAGLATTWNEPCPDN